MIPQQMRGKLQNFELLWCRMNPKCHQSSIKSGIKTGESPESGEEKMRYKMKQGDDCEFQFENLQ